MHPDGELWVSTNNRAWQIDVNTNDWTFVGNAAVANFATHSENEYAFIVHDGHDLWVSQHSTTTVYGYDDGVAEAYWLTVDPTEGELQSGSDVNINIHLDATGLLGGTYIGDIHYLSNDPANSDQVFRATVNVSGAPAIETAPICSPFEGARPVNFADTYVEGQSSIPVMVSNTGTDDLEVNDVGSNNADEFTTDLEANTVISAGEDLTIHLLFHPTDIGQRSGTIQIATNARNLPEGEEAGLVWFDMVGTGQTPPRIVTNPEPGATITVGLAVGADPMTRTLTISNVADEGGDNLDWDLAIEAVDQGRDGNVRHLRGIGGPVREDIRRDDPNDLVILMLKGSQDNGYGWADNNDWRAVFANQNQQVQYANMNDVGNIDLSQFDLVGTGEDQTTDFYQQYTNHRAQIMDYVAHGGLYAMFCGSNTFQQVNLFKDGGDVPVTTGPGGNYATVNPMFLNQQGNGLIAGIEDDYPLLTPYDYFVDGAGDPNHVRIRMVGSSLNYCHVSLNDLPQDAVWYYQAEGQQGQEEIADWPYGHGYVLFTGITGTLFWEANFRWNSGMECQNLIKWAEGRSGLSWLSADPSDGSIALGQSTDITLTFNTDGLENDQDYYADLTIESNDPTNPAAVVHAHLHTGALGPQHYTEFAETASGHVLNVTAATWEQNPLPTGWEIGVFAPGGVLSGGLFWFNDGGAHEFTAYGADENAQGQFQQGQAFVFRFWDADAQQERTTINATIADGPATWVDGGRTTLTLDGLNYYTSRANFLSGWNLISINIVPPQEYWVNEQGADVRRMMAQFHEGDQMHVQLMKDEGGNFYAPAIGDFNNIPFWNLGEGYQVKMDQDIAGEWTGTPIPAGADVPIASGWNMIAYYPTYQLAATVGSNFYVVSPIIDNVVIAKDAAGNFMVPRIPFSNMQPWTEGQGYQINVSADVVLNYPDAQQRQAALPVGNRNSAVVGHWSDHARTGSNMSVLLSAFNGVKVADGDQVAAFGTNDELVGLGTVTNGMCGLAVWGDDPTTEYVDGMKATEAFTLKLWNVEREAEIGLNARITLGDGLIYKTDGFSVATASAVSAIPDNYYLGQNYPNPFNSVTRIAYGLPEASRVSIRVYNAVGQLVQTLVDSDQPAGHHRVSWNGTQISTGIYLVKMEAAGFSSTRKVVLVK